MDKRRRFDLTDLEGLVIAPLLPNESRGTLRADDRRVTGAILWRSLTGSPRADIPERCGPQANRCNRLVRRARG